MTRINSHLILTLEQKKNLRSLPDSKFTDKKWESPNDAVPFLKEHGLIIENKSERKWKVRYSDKAKEDCQRQTSTNNETEEQIESWRIANDELQPWEEIYEKLNLFDKLMYGGVNDYVTNITNNEEFEN
ncbi:hypothetical protein RhiirC2_710209 [Rhizophagus irregularis]|uniref:Uncharacterized protein n=1 Tax=Rhizophagus irregularis TaxID=588596 RepID=A0A2N1NFJ3_9GLOM|nr:hypothetical protein RhiirC2_710209 [Rhizophagus irregularis]